MVIKRDIGSIVTLPSRLGLGKVKTIVHDKNPDNNQCIIQVLGTSTEIALPARIVKKL